jgi:hypothetical protein
MKIKFKDIKPGRYLAKITSIKEENGPYGMYLRFNFTITHGELKDWSFYGIVKPNPFRQSKFYRWMIIILGKEPDKAFSVYELMGKECNIYLQKITKGDKVYYSVKEVLPVTRAAPGTPTTTVDQFELIPG